MHCFYHRNGDAVGICKSCNRGLCSECAVEAPNGLACINRCESEVAAIDHQIQRARTQTSAGGRLYVGIGATIAAFGLWLQEPPAVLMGMLLFGLGVFWVVRGRTRDTPAG